MTSILTGVMILVIIAVGAMGFLFIANEGNININRAIHDPVNSTGILLNNTTGSYEAVQGMTTSISDNLIIGIFLGLLLVIVILIIAWGKFR